MTSRPSLRDRILDLRIAQDILARFGINPRKYRLLLDLFDTLGERLEFMGSKIQLTKVAAVYAGLSFLISLVVFFGPALRNYLLGMLAYSMFFLLWVMMEDTTNSLFNPEEASVLAHQPIGGATYVSAKLTHLLALTALFVPALNGFPAIAGLYLAGSRWFYPFTHLLAAYFAGLSVAFLLCGIYGWLFRFLPPARLKNAALWLQLLVVISPYLLDRARMLFDVRLGHLVSKIAASSWLPFRWFAAIGLLGQTTNSGISIWQGGVAILVTFGLIGFGLRSFKEDYLVKTSSMIQGSAAGRRQSARVSRPGLLARMISGAQSGHGAFSFTSTMLLRDWNFRRQGLPNIMMFLTTVPVVVVVGLKNSPFTLLAGTRRTFSAVHFLPHCLGLLAAITCSLLAYTAEPRGSWIFTILPMGRLKPFIRGIYLSVWIPVVGITHLCLLGPCIWFWGVTQAALFIGYSASVASFYLSLALFLVDGLPFVEAFAPHKAESMKLASLGGVLCAVVLGGLQWILFHSMWLVAGAACIFVLLAFAIGRAGRIRLEKEMGANLQRLSLGPQQIFRDLESSIQG